MHVADILKVKGTDVVTTGPDEGAVVVCDAAAKVVGVISERDIIRGVAVNGARALEMRVRDLMTGEVITCKPTETISEVMKVMTERRFRHLPVVDGGELQGIISIGDVVKNRLEETEMEARVLRDYVIASR